MAQHLSPSDSTPGGSPRPTLRQRISHLAITAWHQKTLWLGLGLFLLLAWQVGATTCVFRSTVGIPCPGCGMTRAWLHVLHGQWREALWQHPLYWLVPPVLITWAAFYRLLPRGRAARYSQSLLIAAGGLMIAVYIIRMILFFPHTDPMTYNHQAFAARLIRLVRQLVLPAA